MLAGGMFVNEFKDLLSFLDTLEVKEINNVWHDTRRTIPEDGSEQIICIKEDSLAVLTSGKIVNGTIKWAYLGDLLNININVEVKEVDFKKEFDNYAKDILACDVQFQPFTHLYNCAKYFYELGIKSQTKDMIEALRTEYEKGRADVIAKTLEWINIFNDNNYIMQYSDSCEHPINEIIEWYKNYIIKE